MASTTVAVRLSDEVVRELQELATAENKKVSDVVKELITSGLARREPAGAGAEQRQLIERLEQLEKLILKTTRAAAKAQFLANMSASFSSDVARLMTTKMQPSKEEKEAFMEQMEGWAEDFAKEALRE